MTEAPSLLVLMRPLGTGLLLRQRSAPSAGLPLEPVRGRLTFFRRPEEAGGRRRRTWDCRSRELSDTNQTIRAQLESAEGPAGEVTSAKLESEGPSIIKPLQVEQLLSQSNQRGVKT